SSAIRRTKCARRQTRRACRRLAMEQSSLAKYLDCACRADCMPGHDSELLGRLRESAANSGGSCGAAYVRQPATAVRHARVGGSCREGATKRPVAGSNRPTTQVEAWHRFLGNGA